jgi:GH18 family chitinase
MVILLPKIYIKLHHITHTANNMILVFNIMTYDLHGYGFYNIQLLLCTLTVSTVHGILATSGWMRS